MVETFFLGLLIALALAACAAPQSVDSPPAATSLPPTAAYPAPNLLTAPPPGELPPPAFPLSGLQVAWKNGPNQVLPAFEAGAYWLRLHGLLWDEIEPEEGQRNWEAAAQLELSLQAAAARGMQPVLEVQGTPAWAQKIPGVFCGPIRQESLEAFGRFLAEAVARYSAPPFNVKYWELGNEPDVAPAATGPKSGFGCWGDPSDPFFGGGYYAEMLKIAYPQIKAADPAAQVLVGGLLLDCDPVHPPEIPPGSGTVKDCTPARFFEGVLAGGGGPFFDGVSFHAYDYYYESVGYYGNSNWNSGFNRTGVEPVIGAKLGYLKAVVAQYGVEGKFFMNTETALLCGRDGQEAACQTEAFARAKNAYVVQSAVAAVAGGLRANIWYSLTGWRGSGLTDRALEPLEAYGVYRFGAAQFNGAAFAGEQTGDPGVKIYRFRRGAVNGFGTVDFWVLWSLDTEAHMVDLGAVPNEAYDMLGNALEPRAVLTVDFTPTYVIWER